MQGVLVLQAALGRRCGHDAGDKDDDDDNDNDGDEKGPDLVWGRTRHAV